MPASSPHDKDPPIETGKRILQWLIIFIAGVFLTAGIFAIWHETTYSEGLLLTLETLSFSPPEATSPIERILQVLIMFFGGFLVWFLFWNFFDLMAEGKLSDYWGEFMQKLRQKVATQHSVIIGGGRVGQYTAEMLEKRKKNVIIVEQNETKAKMLQKRFSVVIGDGLDENVLKKAKVQTAQSVVCALPDTEKNVLITLLVRSINPSADILARCEHPSLSPSLHKAGAHHIIMPEHAAAEQLASIMLGEKPLSHTPTKIAK